MTANLNDHFEAVGLSAVPDTNVTVTDLPKVYPAHTQPYSAAHKLVTDLFTKDGTNTLAWWENSWCQWVGTHWEITDDLTIRQPIWVELQAANVKGSKKSRDGDLDEDFRPWEPTSAKLNNLMEPLQIHTRIQGDSPKWLDESINQPATSFISMENGLLNLDTRRLLEHTPKLFTTWSLPFKYDQYATCPQWSKFLADTFSHDSKAIDLLQEYAGYLISGRTDLQKGLLLVGAKRGGKGVIARIFQQLMGASNTVGLSLGNLGSEFGLEGLIGKPLAIIGDARADDQRRNNTIVERLLNIIGEDTVSINRKNVSYWSGKLPARFMISSNEVPRFIDSSGAILTRFMMVKVVKTVEKPDRTLEPRLATEMSGIFNWALEGLQRLEERREFTRPDTMGDMEDLMSDLSSPVAQFLEEVYEVTGDPSDWAPITEVLGRFRAWSENQGHVSMSRDTLMQRLDAVKPGQVVCRNAVPPNGGKKVRHVRGIRKCWD